MDSCLPDLADGPVPFDCGRFDQSAGTSAPRGPAAICVEHHVCPDFERMREDGRTRLCTNKGSVVMRVAKLLAIVAIPALLFAASSPLLANGGGGGGGGGAGGGGGGGG